MQNKKNLYAIVKSTGELVIGHGEADAPSLEFMQKSVGGCIEHIYTPSFGDIDFWADEEGKLKEKIPNFVGSGIVAPSYWEVGSNWEDYVAGDILIIAHNGEDSRWLTEEELKTVISRHSLVFARFVKWKRIHNLPPNTVK